MASKVQKLIVIIFSVAALASTLIIGYSLTYYVGASLAIRSTFAFVKDFRVELVGEDHIMVSTNVAVNNPSSYQLTWLWVEANVYVNQARAGTQYQIFPENHPLLIPPQAEANHTLEVHLYLAFRPELAKLLSDPSTTKSWVATIDAYCEAPLAGTIKLSTSANKETF